jgi:hypothetical protein
MNGENYGVRERKENKAAGIALRATKMAVRSPLERIYFID